MFIFQRASSISVSSTQCRPVTVPERRCKLAWRHAPSESPVCTPRQHDLYRSEVQIFASCSFIHTIPTRLDLPNACDNVRTSGLSQAKRCSCHFATVWNGECECIGVLFRTTLIIVHSAYAFIHYDGFHLFNAASFTDVCTAYVRILTVSFANVCTVVHVCNYIPHHALSSLLTTCTILCIIVYVLINTVLCALGKRKKEELMGIDRPSLQQGF